MNRLKSRTAAFVAGAAIAGLVVAAVPGAAAQAGYYQYRKCSDAASLSFFVDSTSSTTRWPHQIGHNNVMYAAQEANGRYHVSLWDTSGDTNGWVSTAWVRPC
ncbi:hypothetical protein OG271_21795 [Micromonospora rifamycinica]|uniref:hypothetical protein n=1 Tax=Micromonospora rifamycinica TaxID=291594 RepID=UPI002E2A20C2|nr:hypothetical protein [Micromonospora rifamycinica]